MVEGDAVAAGRAAGPGPRRPRRRAPALRHRRDRAPARRPPRPGERAHRDLRGARAPCRPWSRDASPTTSRGATSRSTPWPCGCPGGAGAASWSTRTAARPTWPRGLRAGAARPDALRRGPQPPGAGGALRRAARLRRSPPRPRPPAARRGAGPRPRRARVVAEELRRLLDEPTAPRRARAAARPRRALGARRRRGGDRRRRGRRRAPAPVRRTSRRWALRLGGGVERGRRRRRGPARLGAAPWPAEAAAGAELAERLSQAGAPSEVDRCCARRRPRRRSAPSPPAPRPSPGGGPSDRAPSVTGADLVRAGVAPGPAIGRALAEVRAAVLDGRVERPRRAARARPARGPGGYVSGLEPDRGPDRRPRRAPSSRRAPAASARAASPRSTSATTATIPTSGSARTGARLCAALGLDARARLHGPPGARRRGARGVGRRGRASSAHLRDWPDGRRHGHRDPGRGAGRARRRLPAGAPLAARHAAGGGRARRLARAGRRACSRRRRGRSGAPGDAGAAIGPGIGPCCYPVSDEVRGAFAARFGADVVVRAPRSTWPRPRAGPSLAGGVPDDGGRHGRGGCTSCEPERFYSHRRDGAGTGRQAGLVWADGAVIDAARLREVLAETRGLLDEAAVRGGRAPGAVELVIAGKYLPAEDVPALLEAGVDLLGENRLQDLLAKEAAAGGRLRFDFIGHLQRRKVRDLLPARAPDPLARLPAARRGDRGPRRKVRRGFSSKSTSPRSQPKVVSCRPNFGLSWMRCRLGPTS